MSQQITPEMLAYPAQLPPPGVIPQLENPPSQGHILIVIGSILQVLMGGFLLNRIFTKVFIVRSFGWDDATCILGALLASAYFAVSVLAVQIAHYGTHLWDITLGEYIKNENFLIAYLTAILAPPTLGLIKLSFFLLYYQLFRPIQGLRMAINIGFVITAIFYLVVWIISLYSMTPDRGVSFAVHTTTNPRVQLMADLALALPIGGIVLDLYILIVPIVGIFNLQLPLHRKFGAALVFFTGTIAVIASILALAYRIPIWSNPLDDLTYKQLPVLITSIVEMMLGVCVACMPSFSRMLRHTLPPFEVLRSRLSGFTSSLKYRSKMSTANSSDKSGKYGGFVNVTESQTSESGFELNPTNTLATHNNWGKNQSRDGVKGIQLTHEVQIQTSAAENWPQRK